MKTVNKVLVSESRLSCNKFLSCFAHGKSDNGRLRGCDDARIFYSVEYIHAAYLRFHYQLCNVQSFSGTMNSAKSE